MSNDLHVTTTLTAVDRASPAITGLLKNIEKLQAACRRFNASFESFSTKSFDSIGLKLKEQTEQVTRSAKAYRTEWKDAYAGRLRDAEMYHRQIDRIERQSLARRQTEQRTVDRGGARSAGRGSLPRGTSPTTTLIAGGITLSGVASAFKKRMEANVAETKAQIFGGLSAAEVKKLRGDWSDQIAIKFGESASVVLDSFSESLKQGFGQDAAKKITEGALESAAALEMNVADLMRLAGKTATSLYGDVRKADPARVVKMMNSVAVAAAATAADPNEVVEANKRALSALSTTKLKETDLSAFTSVGISAGLQPNKAGTALSYLTSEFANAGNARGQRAKDLNQAAHMLGYGNRQQMAQRMASAPTEFMLDMFTKMQNMNEQNRAKFANLAGMREWRDELIQMAKAADQIRETLKEIEQKSDTVSAFSAAKLNSLQKRWDRIKTMFGLAWEKLGSGFEDTFVEISNWFDRHTSLFTSGRIGEKSREFVEKLKKAFGVGSTDEALNRIVGKISNIDVDRIIGFASGFVGGLVSIADSVTAMMKSVAGVMGKDGNSAEVLGKLTGQIVGLSVALGLLAPVITVLAGFTAIIGRLSSLLGKSRLPPVVGTNPIATTAWLAWLMAQNNDTGVSDSAIKRPGETTTQWRERQQKLKELRNYKPSGDPLFQPSSYTGSTDFSGRRRSKVDDLADQLNKFGANVQRAAFISGGPGGGLPYAAIGGSGRGLGRFGGGRSFIGGIPDLVKSVPGQALPSFNAGSIIRRDKIPSFNGGGGSVANPGPVPSFGVDPNVSAGLSGNAYLAARRARFKRELEENPELKKRLAALIDLENPGAGTAVAESLMNRMDMNGGSIARGIGGGSKSFYGPVRRGLVEQRMRELERNPARMASRMKQIDEAAAGSNLIRGHTDQGSTGDPNYVAGGTGVNINRERFNDFGGGRWDGKTGHTASRAYREDLMRHVQEATGAPITSQVPTPADAIQNVPSPIRGDASLGLLRNGVGGGGPVSINIHGNSHDPEALATLVQRRIDETMNWRTHDTASEYT
jgi:TP901 family phage tail tape measure protein